MMFRVTLVGEIHEYVTAFKEANKEIKGTF